MNFLIDPLWLSLITFGIQGTIWWFFMPEKPMIPGVAPRYQNEVSLMRYGAFLLVWLIAMGWGRFLASGVSRRSARAGSSPAGGPARSATLSPHMVRYLIKVARVGLALSLLGELVYIRGLIGNPQLLLETFRSGWIGGLAESARSESVMGLSSLLNLYLVPTAIFAGIGFNPLLDEETRKSSRKWLIRLGLWVFIRAMLLSGRAYFLNFLFVILVAYLLQGGRVRISKKLLALGGVVALFIIWLGELLRVGLYYSTVLGLPLFSAPIQNMIFTRLVEGYFASEFNNAQILLNCSPSMMFVLTSVSLANFANRLFGLELHGYDYYCPEFTSVFGTLNVFGLWWLDAGWFGLLYALLMGIWLRYTYYRARQNASTLGLSFFVYLIAFPGVPLLAKGNYFSLTLFLLPLLFLLGAWSIAPRLRRTAKSVPPVAA